MYVFFVSSRFPLHSHTCPSYPSFPFGAHRAQHKQYLVKVGATSSHDLTDKDPDGQRIIDDFNKFFKENYKIVLTAQSEMKYFPPAAKVREWKEADKLLPNRIDQPEIIELTKKEVEAAVETMKKNQ